MLKRNKNVDEKLAKVFIKLLMKVEKIKGRSTYSIYVIEKICTGYGPFFGQPFYHRKKYFQKWYTFSGSYMILFL